VIASVLQNKVIPVYGTGANIRDWLYVEDHVRAIDTILHQGKIGETYCIGGDTELSNLELVHFLVDEIDHQLGKTPGTSKTLISFVEDRKGHDFRYAIDHSKLTKELGWSPTTSLEKGIKTTVSWYLNRVK
jgi:dTDP-glucose 4,6-dehydratase